MSAEPIGKFAFLYFAGQRALPVTIYTIESTEKKNGAGEGIRTPNQPLTRRLLYR